ncbi:MAG TPA: NAD-dependent epimerase/dehydratase family protein [Nostocaceae cyanobacterium]|nr:NAD-dependent epimerase/dehydratase family protein [Nostocaceae cyanobacterium]
MNKILITGVAGFIGSHLAEILLKKGYQVIGVDNFNGYYEPGFQQNNIAPFKDLPEFQLVRYDIQFANWQNLLKDVEIIYHQAAQTGVRTSWGKGFSIYSERNINATQILLEAAKDAPKLKRFIFASTASVYGETEILPTNEEVCPQPVSPYGITKLAAERLCQLYFQNFGIPIVILRYFTVYGPRQRADMAFHKFFKAILENEAISIYGDGRQTRDFTFVSDITAANLAAAVTPNVVGEIFNIGSGSRVGLAEVLETITEIVGKPVKKNYIATANDDARHTAADISKARQILGYQPQISLKEGLIKEWEWIKSLYTPQN